jgi:hypothetical protein
MKRAKQVVQNQESARILRELPGLIRIGVARAAKPAALQSLSALDGWEVQEEAAASMPVDERLP